MEIRGEPLLEAAVAPHVRCPDAHGPGDTLPGRIRRKVTQIESPRRVVPLGPLRGEERVPRLLYGKRAMDGTAGRRLHRGCQAVSGEKRHEPGEHRREPPRRSEPRHGLHLHDQNCPRDSAAGTEPQ